MPITNTANINPTSTAAAYGPGTRGGPGTGETYIFPAVGASAVKTLPKLESYPAMFAICSTGTSNQVSGFVTVTAASNVAISGGVNLSGTAGSNVLVPTAVAGVLTLTANGTFTSRDIHVTRIG